MIAAEQKARVTYDNILRLSDDPDVNDVTIATVFPVCFDNGLFGPFPEKRDYAFVVHANTSFDFL